MRKGIRITLVVGVLGLSVYLWGNIVAQEQVPKEWEQKNHIERGKYLVDHLAECIGCHTPLGPGGPGHPDMKLYLSGVPEKFAGKKEGPPQVAGFPGPGGSRHYPSNITPDPETGIGKWTEEQFVRAMRVGIRPDGTKYDKSQMEWEVYRNMKEEDIRAIYRYLMTVKPIRNRVPANIPASAK